MNGPEIKARIEEINLENKKLITNEKNEHFLGYCIFTNINDLFKIIEK